MRNAIKTLVQDFGWIHLSLGLCGNILFFSGSILFLPVFDPLQTFGTWCFIVGSFLMMIGAIGQLLVDLFERAEKK